MLCLLLVTPPPHTPPLLTLSHTHSRSASLWTYTTTLSQPPCGLVTRHLITSSRSQHLAGWVDNDRHVAATMTDTLLEVAAYLQPRRHIAHLQCAQCDVTCERPKTGPRHMPPAPPWDLTLCLKILMKRPNTNERLSPHHSPRVEGLG